PMNTLAIALPLLLAAPPVRADSLTVAPPPAPPAHADSAATRVLNTHPPVIAVRLTAPVIVDGILSEAVWHNEFAVTDFKMRDPNEGAAPSQRTEVRVAYDDAALYVGARCYDAHPESLLVRLSRRDVPVASDRSSLYLDPYHH